MRSLIAKIVLLVVTLACCLGVGEIWLRAAAARSGAANNPVRQRFAPYVSDSTLGYRLRPDWRGVHEHADFRVAVRINDLGMRGGPVALQRAAGRPRILVLGDSYAFGFGVEEGEAFPSLLEAQLHTEGRKVEVLNAAVPGYGADHPLLYLETRGFALDPDLVLVAVCSNDAEDLGTSELELGADNLPARIQSRLRMIDRHGRMQYVNQGGVALPGWVVEPPAWLQDTSHLFNWLRYRVARVWIGFARSRDREHRAAAAGAPPTGAIAELQASEVERGLAHPEFQRRYHRYLISALERAAARRNVALRFVVVGPRPGAFPGECERRADCLDLATVVSPDEHLESFHPIDGHWNALGHRRAATKLHGWLVADASLPLGTSRP